MVFHIFERIFSPLNFQYDSQAREKQFMAEGFSEVEAQNLAWLVTHNNTGRVLGLGAGFFVVYSCKNVFATYAKKFPRLYYQNWLGLTVKLATIWACYKFGDYFYTSRRYGANFKLTNGIAILSNRLYIDNKEAFIQHFEPLNRKFTEEEVEQFLNNREVRFSNLIRRWIYNPYVHGPDEKAWREQIKDVFELKSAPWNNQRVLDKIKAENAEKEVQKETVLIAPFKLTKHIDTTGRNIGMAQNPFSTQWSLLQ